MFFLLPALKFLAKRVMKRQANVQPDAPLSTFNSTEEVTTPKPTKETGDILKSKYWS